MSGRARIAPTLQEDVERRRMGEMARECRIEDCRRCERGKRELRALLEVVRAATHLVREDRNRAPGSIHCSFAEACSRTERALARLERASGTTKRERKASK